MFLFDRTCDNDGAVRLSRGERRDPAFASSLLQRTRAILSLNLHAKRSSAMNGAADPNRSRCRALLIEDDAAIRRLVSKLLTRNNIEVDAVEDGHRAIAHLTDRGDYSVIVLDLMLGETSGFEVLDFIKSRGISVPVAVVSAVSHQALTRLDLDIVKLVISKPFDVDEFTRAIVALCEESPADAETGPQR